MRTKHLLILGAWLASLSSMVNGLGAWHEVYSNPSVVFGILGSLGTQILAFYIDSPGAE